MNSIKTSSCQLGNNKQAVFVSTWSPDCDFSGGMRAECADCS